MVNGVVFFQFFPMMQNLGSFFYLSGMVMLNYIVLLRPKKTNPS